MMLLGEAIFNQFCQFPISPSKSKLRVEWQKSRSTQTHLYRVDAPPCRLYVTPASVPQMHHSERGGCVERRRTATKQVQELAALRKSRGCREHQVVTPFGYVHSTDHHDVVGVLCKGKEEGCEQGGVSDKNKMENPYNGPSAIMVKGKLDMYWLRAQGKPGRLALSKPRLQ